MFEINKLYHGFRLLEESRIDEIQSLARVFYHEKSGARLMQLENDDNNKVFTIGFRTPPTDSTGVPHILEHCVLSGSRKYTTKEPFMDMVKGSLQTFINAMTFSDKTIYPVASRNEKDFFNLMDVYLDAVFYPKIYELEDIFMQEGWHHEIFNKEEKIRYKGVVYNEMKGAYSTPETILDENIGRSLFPDTTYQHSSGGNPDVIPELKYDDFLDFHKSLYHPSNSYIYLYGDGDLDSQLKHINEEYLSNFDKIQVDSKIDKQEAFDSINHVNDYYPISKDDKDEDKTYLSLNFVMGEKADLKNTLSKDIISQILIGSEAAPLKKALLEEGLGEDIFTMDIDGLQSGFGIVAKNTSKDKKDIFQEKVFATLNKLVEEGIDKDLIEASINIVEYNLREVYKIPTKGIMFYMMAMDSWLYDGNPMDTLRYGSVIKDLRQAIDTDYFEEYIRKNIIDNPHSSLVIIEPKKGLSDDKEKALEEELDDYKRSLSEEELEKLIQENEKLRSMQLSDDKEEDKATIPKLSRSDVNPEAEIIPQEISKEENTTILFQDIFTSKIAYLDLYFDTSMIKEEHIAHINLLSALLGKMDTKDKSYAKLSNDIYVNTGGINFSTTAFTNDNRDDKYSPKFRIMSKGIGDNIPNLMELIVEIITETKLDDGDRIREILLQMKSRMEMYIINSGNAVAAGRVSSYFSAYSNYMEKLGGLEYYWFISDLIANFDEEKEKLIENLKEVYETIFNENNLIVSFTGDKEDYKLIRENLHTIRDRINKEKTSPAEYSFKEEKLNEAILSNSNVQYVAKGYDFKKLGYEYDGSMIVLATILSGDYLHNRIRAQGGAYGAGISIHRSGRLTTHSYRDPNLSESLDVYNNMGDYIRNLELSGSDLNQYIIGSIARLEPAMTSHVKGQVATSRYISNISQEDIQKTRDQVLATSLETIKSYAPILDDTMKEDYLCVLGNESKIEANKSVFKNLVKLNK